MTFPLKSLRITRILPTLSLTALSTLLLVSCSSAPATNAVDNACPTPPPAEANHVRVIPRRYGNVTRFFVQNDEYCEVTMTFEMHAVNLAGTVQFPYTATFPA